MPSPSPSPTSNKFRVRMGTHSQNGRVYTQGEIIESPHDLIKAWPNKFDLVADAAPVSKGLDANLPLIPSQLRDGTNKKEEAKADPEAEKSDAAPAKVKRAAKPKGLDVTDRFDGAKEQDFSVFKVRGEFFVYNNDDMTTPVNAKGAEKDAVGRIIEEALAAAGA
jgi:hypothetical protein